MNIRRFWLTTFLMLSGIFSGASELSPTDEAFAPGTVGQWKGNARIVVVWAKQTNLCVTLDIRDDGAVTGKIGDALLTHGRLKKNRGWLDRNLKVKTDYIIVGHLDGAIITAEGITRPHVKIPLNLSSETLTGGIHTCGSQFGGKDQMILSAGHLTLTRAGAP